MLFRQTLRLAASRTFWMAGSNRPIRTAIMAMTTSSSIRVKAGRRRGTGMAEPREGDDGKEGRQSEPNCISRCGPLKRDNRTTRELHDFLTPHLFDPLR